MVTLPKSCPDIKAFLTEKLKFFADNDDVYRPRFSQEGAFIFQYIEVPDYGLDSAQDAVAEVLGVDKPKSIAHNPADGHLAPQGPYSGLAQPYTRLGVSLLMTTAPSS
ncbi:hypothetical protein NW767_008697 [Fusarium falciforme]|nr:hypothetical protein NW767_008697 [Fusarium falciforme]